MKGLILKVYGNKFMWGMLRSNNRKEFRGKVQFMIMGQQVSQRRGVIKENKRPN